MKIENHERTSIAALFPGEEKPAVKNAEKQPFGIVTVSMGKRNC